MRVKICGITSHRDAELAVSLGADALGFLVGLDYRADDEITPSHARAIIGRLPPLVSSVLVTHKTEVSWIVEACKAIRCDTVQLHGPFPLQKIASLKVCLPHVKIVKTVHVQDERALGLASEAGAFADAILLDTMTESRIGGTGKVHDWSISQEIVKSAPVPVILAGGLNPENIQDAIFRVRPFAVDINSGVEEPDGTESAERIRVLIVNAREAFRQLKCREASSNAHQQVDIGGQDRL